MEKTRLRWIWTLVLVLLFCGAGREVRGQGRVRVYAKSQLRETSLGGNVANGPLAVDQNLSTGSIISIAIAGSAWQELIFPETVQSGTSVYVKIGTSTGILNLLSGISAQAFSGNTPVGNAQTFANLLSLLNGADQGEIKLTPSGNYDRVRISASGIALGGGVNIYESYYYRAEQNVFCNQPLDVLYGANGAILGGLNIVANPLSAIDNNNGTFSTLNGTVSVANKTHLTTLHPSLSNPGDSIQIVLRNPAGLIAANLLSTNFSITTYNDNTNNGALALDQSILQLSLLSTGSQIQVLRYPVQQPFNRIEISLGGGLVNALQTLHIYEVKRVLAKPIITSFEMVNDVVKVCEGDQITLSIQNFVSGRLYKWYDKNMNLITSSNSSSYIPNQAFVYGNDYAFYVSVSDIGCSEESNKSKVIVNVLPKGGKPHLTISDVIN